MRLRTVWEGSAVGSAAEALPPLGPGMTGDRVATATRLERWESEWGDSEDHTEWRLYRDQILLETRRVEGF